MSLGNCTQCGQPARFKFSNIPLAEITFPDQTKKMIPKDYQFCDEHWIALINELLLHTDYITVRKTEEPPA